MDKYKCSRCGKTHNYRSSAEDCCNSFVSVIADTLIDYGVSSVISSLFDSSSSSSSESSSSSSDFGGFGGGDFGGGGSGGDY